MCKFYISYVGIIIFVLLFLSFTNGNNKRSYFVQLERSVINCSKLYASNCLAKIYKYNRSSDYALNVSLDILHRWDQNVTVLLKSYEFKNNQYKESIISFEKPVCDVLDYEKFVVPLLLPFSNMPRKCPVLPGSYYVKDMVPIEKILPRYFPLSKWKFRADFITSITKKQMGFIEVYFKVEDIGKQKKKQ